jgi:hypothetical protein
MAYFATVLGVFFFVAMLLSLRQQKRLRSAADLAGEVRLLLPVDAESVRELFDPAVEWSLRAKSTPHVFKLIQTNRRKLAIQQVSHMFRNARSLQRIGYAGWRSHKREEIIKGKILVDAGVPVRLRSLVLLIFLRFQQVTYTSSNLSCLRDLTNDLLPDWDELVYAASNLSRIMDPRLHAELSHLLTPPAGHVAQ